MWMRIFLVLAGLYLIGVEVYVGIRYGWDIIIMLVSVAGLGLAPIAMIVLGIVWDR